MRRRHRREPLIADSFGGERHVPVRCCAGVAKRSGPFVMRKSFLESSSGTTFLNWNQIGCPNWLLPLPGRLTEHFTEGGITSHLFHLVHRSSFQLTDAFLGNSKSVR